MGGSPSRRDPELWESFLAGRKSQAEWECGEERRLQRKLRTRRLARFLVSVLIAGFTFYVLMFFATVLK